MQEKFNYALSEYIAVLALFLSVLLCHGAFLLVFSKNSILLLYNSLLCSAFLFFCFFCQQSYRFLRMVYYKIQHKAAIIIDNRGIVARGLATQQDFYLSWQDIEHIYIHSANRWLVIRPLPATFEKMKSKKIHSTEMVIQEMIVEESLEYLFWKILPFWQPSIEREATPPPKKKSKKVFFECTSGVVILTFAAYFFILFFYYETL